MELLFLNEADYKIGTYASTLLQFQQHLHILLHPFRQIILGTFIVFTFTYCVAVKKTESSFIDRYFGKVKTVTTIEYIGTDTSSITIENFNTKGRPVKFEFYHTTYAAPKSVDEFTYDQSGHKTQTLKIDAQGDTTIINHKSSDYDNVTQLTIDEKKLDPEIPSKAKTRIIGTKTSGKTKRKSILYLDKNGKSIESHDFDENGKLVEKSVMEDDHKGNQLSWTRFRQDTVVFYITQTFDRYSNVITYQRIDPGKMPQEKKFYRYDYDKHHNWIHKYLVQGKKEKLIEKQIIEYYK